MNLKKAFVFSSVFVSACALWPHRSPAPITYRSGEGITVNTPGTEEIPNASDAQAQLNFAQVKEQEGDLDAAISAYLKTVKRFPKSDVAPKAQLKAAQLSEKQKNLGSAFKAYENFVKNYPRSSDFDTALEGEFRIGTEYLEGAKQKLLGVPTLPSMDTAVKIFASVIKNAPFSKYAPLAQFNIGVAREKDHDLKSAISAYQAVIDKYPTDPVAADALYQTGYVWLLVSRNGTYDRNATLRAREAFEDFLTSYPNNERAAQAQENLASLINKQTIGALKIAQFYDKQKQFRAAVIYYNEVLRENPNSPDATLAKTRLAEFRKKYGDTVIEGITQPGNKDSLQVASNTTTKQDLSSIPKGQKGQTPGKHRADYNGPFVEPAPTPEKPGQSLSTVPETAGSAPALNLPPAIPEPETTMPMSTGDTMFPSSTQDSTAAPAPAPEETAPGEPSPAEASSGTESSPSPEASSEPANP